MPFNPINLYADFYIYLSSIIDSYGLALFLLSILTFLASKPLTFYASKIVKKENDIQSVLVPQIDAIQTNFNGQEKHQKIERLYRRYGYSPLYSIRKVAPLFVQLPFLFITYYMLADLEELNGESFLFISNLAQPDQLLWGDNLLPFLMTLINLLVAVTSANMTPKEFRQSSIIALVFLFLLYTMNSALLIYWTFNNLLLLIANIMSQGYLNSAQRIKTALQQAIFFLWKPEARLYSTITITAIVLTLFFKSTNTQEIGFPTSNSSAFALIISLAFAISAVSLTVIDKINLKRQNIMPFWKFSIFLAASTVIVTGLILLISKMPALILLDNSITIYLCGSLLIIGTAFLFIKTAYKAPTLDDIQSIRKVLSFCVLIPATLILFFTPLNIYLEAPEEFYQTPFIEYLKLTLIIYIPTSLILSFLVVFSPRKLLIKLLPISLFLFIYAICYQFFVSSNLGVMSDFKFDTRNILQQQDVLFLVELILLLLAIKACSFFKLKISRSVPLISYMVLLSTGAILITKTVSFEGNYTKIAQQSNTKEQQDSYNLSLSDKQENLLVLLLDGYSGGYLDKFLKSTPEYQDSLKDFTYYPQTLATNGGTVGALAAISAGTNYTPEALSANDRHLTEAIQDSVDRLPKFLAEKDVTSTFINPMRTENLEVETVQIAFTKSDKVDEAMKHDYLKKVNLSLSTYRMAPYFLKFYFVDLLEKEFLSLNPAGYSSKKAGWDLLNRISTESTRITPSAQYAFIRLTLPHSPNIIAENGEFLNSANGTYESEAKWSLHKTILLIEKLKKEGLYENTNIAIISDHGWHRLENQFEDGFMKKIKRKYGSTLLDPSLSHSIMLIKPAYKIQDKMVTNNRLTSNAEMLNLLCPQTQICKDYPDLDPNYQHSPTRIYNKIFYSHYGPVEDGIKEQWIVKGNLFQAENWTKSK